MSKIRQRFYANRDLREFDARLTHLEETIQQVLDFLSAEDIVPEAMELLHTGGGKWRVIRGDRIVFPYEGSANKPACLAFMKSQVEGDNAQTEGADVDEPAVDTPQETPPKSDKMPKKMGSREIDGRIERYVEFTDDTEMVLTEEQFLKAREDPGSLMELIDG